MNYRFTLVLLVIAIVAIAGFGIAQKQLPSSSGAATPTPAPLLAVPSTADVLGLDVKTQGKETDVVKDPNNNNQWKLVKPVDYPYVDQSKVDDVVGQLTTLQGTSSVAKATDDLAPFGLTNPRMTITLQENSNKTETLLIGDPTMNSNNYYAMKQGGSDVELVINTLVDGLTNLANNPPQATPTPTSTPTPLTTPTPAQTPQPSASA